MPVAENALQRFGGKRTTIYISGWGVSTCYPVMSKMSHTVSVAMPAHGRRSRGVLSASSRAGERAPKSAVASTPAPRLYTDQSTARPVKKAEVIVPRPRAARGSLTGRWKATGDNRPNIRGHLTLEQDLPAGTTLHVAGWTREVAGVEFVSLSATVAIGGARARAPATLRGTGGRRGRPGRGRTSGAGFG
jgi:hypothetical protein